MKVAQKNRSRLAQWLGWVWPLGLLLIAWLIAPLRAGGTYPAPAFDAARNRLDVIYADTIGGKAQIMLTWASAGDLTRWSMPTVVSPGSGDRFQAELSTAPNGRLDVSFYDRSYSANQLVDMTYATSSDGGQTWRRARVSPTSFDPYA